MKATIDGPRGSSVLVITRSEPDLDGVACAYAYAEFLSTSGTPSAAWYSGEPDGEATFALQQLPGLRFATAAEASLASRFILVDSSDLDGLPTQIEPAQIVEVIDHRFYTDAERFFPNAKLQIEAVGAAATLIAEYFIRAQQLPSPASATILFGAIQSNTLALAGDIATARDRTAASWLFGTGLVPEDWIERQFAHRRSQICSNFAAFLARERKHYDNPEFGGFEISQLEFFGAAQALALEASTIREQILKSTYPRALNLVDLDGPRSFFITSNHDIQSRVASSLGVLFKHDIAEFVPARLRKQMVLAINGKP